MERSGDDPYPDTGPEEPWEARAIELELDIHAAVYGGGHTYEQLADRVEALIRDHADVEDVARMAGRGRVDDVGFHLSYYGPNYYVGFVGTGAWPELRCVVCSSVMATGPGRPSG